MRCRAFSAHRDRKNPSHPVLGFAKPCGVVGVAELVDAPDLGSGAYGVGVRVPSPAPLNKINMVLGESKLCGRCVQIKSTKGVAVTLQKVSKRPRFFWQSIAAVNGVCNAILPDGMAELGFVAHIGSRTFFPLPETDLGYGLSNRYARRSIATEHSDTDFDFHNLSVEVPCHGRLAH